MTKCHCARVNLWIRAKKNQNSKRNLEPTPKKTNNKICTQNPNRIQFPQRAQPSQTNPPPANPHLTLGSSTIASAENFFLGVSVAAAAPPPSSSSSPSSLLLLLTSWAISRPASLGACEGIELWMMNELRGMGVWVLRMICLYVHMYNITKYEKYWKNNVHI